MKKRTYIKIGMLVILLAVLTITSNVVENKNTIQTSAGVNLDNKKVEWGIRRSDNHEQPDLGSKNKKIIDENEDMAIGNNEEKYVYLTFDEGYEAGYSSSILDTLKENDVKAAFFITGHYLNSQPELVERMIQEGHIVGNHTVNHPSMPSLNEEKLKEEVMKLHTTVYEKFGYEMKYLRPPKGEFSERTLWQTKQLGYTTVMWSFAYDDWDENKQGREAYGKEKILKNVHNGAIILLHANSKDNCNILDSVIKEIKNMGYEFKSLDEFKR
jgi:peptidoglycan-N-acetylmuramic acid deacetylase